MVSSKQLTTFSDFRCPLDALDFLPTEVYCDYLKDYCSNFKLWPHIRLSTKVVNIRRDDEIGHIISYTFITSNMVEEWACDAVALCTGLHVIPNIPHIPGINAIPEKIHSSEFKNRSQLGVGRDVLILGSGETGMDLGYLAVTSPTKSVTLSHRDGFLCAPKAISTSFQLLLLTRFQRVPDPVILSGLFGVSKQLNVPVDVSSASLFDTAYVHPILDNSPLLWAYYDRFIKYTLWMVSGTKHGLDQWVGGISNQRYHASKSVSPLSSWCSLTNG
jgi:dimethylaniline monooxygenase (N-oxide forming)